VPDYIIKINLMKREEALQIAIQTYNQIKRVIDEWNESGYGPVKIEWERYYGYSEVDKFVFKGKELNGS
jgi:hypothetical protein